jgi:hypothetical protein
MLPGTGGKSSCEVEQADNKSARDVIAKGFMTDPVVDRFRL